MSYSTKTHPVKVRSEKKFATKKSTYAAKIETLRRREVRKMKRGEI